MRRKDVLGLTLAVVCLLLGASLGYAVPQLINYQGRLGSSESEPVTGTRSITFAIYDAATEGSLLWQETQTVQVTNGLFNVLLGSVTPIQGSVFNEDSRFLGIKVENDPEMIPRHQLVSVGYAFTADNLGGGVVNVNDTGDVGIGTMAPKDRLDVNGRILRKGQSFSVAGSVNHAGTVEVPWGTTNDWNIFVSPRLMGHEETNSENDNALLRIECYASESSSTAWGITARYKYKFSNSRPNGTWYDGSANYILVPQ
ncbi:MAG: hypothetical protein AB1797_10845 [bacterium]